MGKVGDDGRFCTTDVTVLLDTLYMFQELCTDIVVHCEIIEERMFSYKYVADGEWWLSNVQRCSLHLYYGALRAVGACVEFVCVGIRMMCLRLRKLRTEALAAQVWSCRLGG